MRERAFEVVEWLRRRVPSWLLPVLVEARFRLSWRSDRVRDDARRQMGFLLEHTRPDADLDEVARAYVRRQIWRGEQRWHPEQITHLRVEGIEHLRAAQALGRGVILNFMHHGSYEGTLASVGRAGIPSRMLVHPYMVEPGAPRWLRQHVTVATSGGGEAVSAGIGATGILELLRRGEVVAIAFDVPGNTPVRFAGHDVRGSFGAARTAAAADAPVVLLTAERDERGPYVRLHEPLLPADFADPRDLFEAMLARHEAVVVRWPEDTDLPLARWGEGEAS